VAAIITVFIGVLTYSTSSFATCIVPNMLTNGQMADATQVMTDLNALATCVNTAVTPVQTPPQGRLTLTSNTPVMTADATAQTTIYYTPYQGNQVPVAGVMYSFSQISYSLSTTAHVGGNLYDLFAYNASGSIALCTSPAWSSVTARSAGINMSNGIWTNQYSLTCTVSGGGSTTTVPANTATYLGTFYATANGQTGVAFQPSAAAGGTNTIVGLFNGYNRVPVWTMSRDNAINWTYATTTYRPTHNSSGNRVSYVDGLGVMNINVRATMLGEVPSGTYGAIGTVRDSTSATPTMQCNYGNGGAQTQFWVNCEDSFLPLIGFHYLQGMENRAAGAGTAVFYGSVYQSIVGRFEM